MNRTKTLSLMIVTLIFASLIAACAPAPVGGDQTAEAGSATAEDEVVELVMWHNHPEWKDRVQAILDAFEEEYPNIKIALEEIPGPDYTVKLNTALTAGEAPDLISFSPGLELRTAAESDYLHDLTDLLNTEDLTPSGKDSSLVDDKVYAVPVLGAYTVGLYYHRDVFEELGLTPPATWEELFEVAEALQAEGITPMMTPSQDGVIPFFLYMMAASSILGADGFEKVRAGEIKLTDPELLPAAVFLREMFDIWQEGALGMPYTEGKALFAHGQAAMMAGGSADYAGYTEVNPEVNLGVVPFPAPAGVGNPSTVTGMERNFGINAETEHLDEAVTFLQWMLGQKAGKMVADSITLAPIKGVAPSENPTMQEMIEASKSNDVRVWYEFPETAEVMGTVREHSQRLLTDEITPEEFAQIVQDSIAPSGE